MKLPVEQQGFPHHSRDSLNPPRKPSGIDLEITGFDNIISPNYVENKPQLLGVTTPGTASTLLENPQA